MKRLLTGALALALLSGTTAMAQPDYRNNHRDDQRSYNQDRGHDNGRDDRGWRNDHRGDGHHWARGQRLPREYYEDRGHYVDYRIHHLRRPPAGYRWVRTDDNNYVMVALGTGLIASIIVANQ